MNCFQRSDLHHETSLLLSSKNQHHCLPLELNIPMRIIKTGKYDDIFTFACKTSITTGMPPRIRVLGVFHSRHNLRFQKLAIIQH